MSERIFAVLAVFRKVTRLLSMMVLTVFDYEKIRKRNELPKKERSR